MIITKSAPSSHSCCTCVHMLTKYYLTVTRSYVQANKLTVLLPRTTCTLRKRCVRTYIVIDRSGHELYRAGHKHYLLSMCFFWPNVFISGAVCCITAALRTGGPFMRIASCMSGRITSGVFIIGQKDSPYGAGKVPMSA